MIGTSKSARLEFFYSEGKSLSVSCVFDRLYQENWLEQWATKKVNRTVTMLRSEAR